MKWSDTPSLADRLNAEDDASDDPLPLVWYVSTTSRWPLWCQYAWLWLRRALGRL